MKKLNLLFSSTLIALPFLSPQEAWSMDDPLEPAIHILGRKVNFIPGAFNLENDNESLFTIPNQPKEKPAQTVKIYSGQPKDMNTETILMRANSYRDGRNRVMNTTQWPFLFHGQLSLYFDNEEYGGSGFMVGPHHVLTAGHNVYNQKKKAWVNKAVMWLALNETAAPFDEAIGVKIYAFKEWVTNANPAFDMALIILDQSIGLKTGWCGLLSVPDKTLVSENVQVTGYPGDKGFKQMWSMSHKIKFVKDETLHYEIDTYGGQSGGAIWIYKWGSPYAVGVHAYGTSSIMGENSGSRLSKKKLRMLATWIKETKDIQQNCSQFLFSSSSTILTNDQSLLTHLFERVAKSDAEAHYKLSEFYYTGTGGVEKDLETAKNLCLRAAELGYVDAQYQIAEYFHKGLFGFERDFAKAAFLYQKAAEKGHLGAFYQLGQCFYTGEGVEKDLEKSKLLLCKAAELGYVEAEYQVANCFHKELFGFERDFAKAAFLYQKAAEKGHLGACYQLAQCFHTGTGVEKDLEKSKLLLCRAAELGYSEAEYQVAECLYNGFFGFEKDLDKAVSFYKKAAEKEYPEALYKLSRCYKEGKGVPYDKTQALYWHQKAADNGHAEAQFKLARAFESGCYVLNVKKNPTSALFWYQKSAEQGYAPAQYQLAHCFYCGSLGVENNPKNSLFWYQKSAEQGYAPAQFSLANCFFYGINGAEKNPTNALFLYQKAAEQGDAQAQYKLAELFYKGEYIEEDLEKALSLYLESIKGEEIEKEFIMTVNLRISGLMSEEKFSAFLSRLSSAAMVKNSKKMNSLSS